jgi:hypothetical protein
MEMKNDTISMSLPLFIRCLEWAKENARNDVDLHSFAENVAKINGTITVQDYDSLIPKGAKGE